ncbi:metal-dependent hydrolase [Alteromonas ponticola]|uniref:Metal-dependent hydrolase n=1 Tax=Alteromonas ponticola TaxID=2720613 RepID=A0ABX1R0Q4_9ALTE|nr:metal-dependent hydrolase [Alteromonas ponticola]NMH60059.1 metal-dependent hydrolase [Alteromonas ponticola]
MDPVTQGVIGATAALVISKDKTRLKHAAFIGAAAGMAPDLDILLQSSQDPLLALELHRQFTHALFFIPIGGFIVASLLWLLFYRAHPFKSIYWCATAGYATHGLLDSCTSYGTQLLWPFTHLRIAWDTIGIIDLFVTLPLLIGIAATCLVKRKHWLYLSVAFFAAYMGLGVLQHHRAINTVDQLVRQNSHQATRIKAMPTIGNLIVWRTLYEANQRYYVNAIALPIMGEPRIYPGTVIEKLNMMRDFPSIEPGSVHADDVERFRWFTDNWLVVDPKHAERISDLRYSAQVEKVKPLWGIELNADKQHQHVNYIDDIPSGNRDLIPLDKIFDSSSSEQLNERLP